MIEHALFANACMEVASIHKLGDDLGTGHKRSYFEEAAIRFHKAMVELNIGWVSVKDRLPEIGEQVNIYGVLKAFKGDYPERTFEPRIEDRVTFYGKKEEGKLWLGGCSKEEGKLWLGGWSTDCVTHWHPLPKAPNK